MAHNERCGKCKATVQAMLEKIYGPVTPNYRIALGTRPEEYAGEVVYPALSRVYSALQQHRGYEDFVRAQHVAADFFITDPGFVVEFDESQHFTKSRLIALENYPAAMQVGYSVPRWRELCAALNKRDKDPPYRDEQRAWYDTLRDFLPEIKGYLPTVRLYAREMVWCELDPENPGDVERFRNLLEQKMDNDSVRVQKAGADNWVASVILQSNREKDPGNNAGRLDILASSVRSIMKTVPGDGVIIFPAGWVHTGEERADTKYSCVEGLVAPLLRETNRHVVVCVGIDGYLDEMGFDRDQVALAIDRSGIIAAGKKFHPSPQEKAVIEPYCAQDYLSPEVLPNGEEKSRIFNLNGTRYYLSVCYDIYGGHHCGLENPGADVVLNHVHRFPRTGEGSSESRYARCGFGGASKQWSVPVYGTSIYIGRDIPGGWPAGVVWKAGDISTQKCTYDDITLPPNHILGPIPVPEGHVEVRVFSDVPSEIDPVQVPALSGTGSTPKQKTRKSAQKPVRRGRDRFADVIGAFENGVHYPTGLERDRYSKDQCRYSFRAWQRIKDKPIKYVCYEFNDWIGHGKPEISVEVLFGLEAFRDIAEIVHARAPEVQGKLPSHAGLNWETSTCGWLRLQYVFPDTVEPGIIADSMVVLVEETRDVINDWLKEEKMSHY